MVSFSRSPLVCEHIGDHVTIRKDNTWQIKVSSQLGTIDSWKVGSVHSDWKSFVFYLIRLYVGISGCPFLGYSKDIAGANQVA